MSAGGPGDRHPSAPAPGATVPSHNPGCFGCGTGVPGGLGVRLVAGEGVTVTGRFRVGASHEGAPGLAHGGILSAACDEVLGGLLWILWVPAVTASLQLDYLAPVPVGGELLVEARLVRREGRKIFAEGVGRVADTDVLRCSALFVQVPMEHFTKHGGRAGGRRLFAP